MQTAVCLPPAPSLKHPAPSVPTDLVLRLTSSPEPSAQSTSSKVALRPPILVNGVLVPYTNKPYKCTYQSCGKSYSKPSRLEEHQRSHTGDRPFVCHTCDKSYFRETHLHAHARSHLPASARPFVCEGGCAKRFWTAQHLRAHMDWHNGTKPFTCTENGCNEAFAKHHQLRSHFCTAHAPPGTKPYRCDHDGCTKSFDTNQHLRAHLKTHDSKRYLCAHPGCLTGPDMTPTYFPNWTTLQTHMRTAHPPTCSRPSCSGRRFASQKGLRAHQKLHEQQDLEMMMDVAIRECDDEEDQEPPRKRRRGGEVGRDWKCETNDCGKDFKSKKALITHQSVTHVGRRNFACLQPGCGCTYGYKHLLQRHMAKAHIPSSSSSSGSSIGEEPDHDVSSANRTPAIFDIDMITGNAYAIHAQAQLAATTKMLRCPYPDLSGFQAQVLPTPSNVSAPQCDYIFTRAYDFRRHMHAFHSTEVSKEETDAWVKRQRQNERTSS
ncbi:hypothetical protein BDQ17DRAFT_1311014 [Cyathus striatus]|nr:hypothetical protein BDQ17DRAFT_1311014 [Cyathus striatus]